MKRSDIGYEVHGYGVLWDPRRQRFLACNPDNDELLMRDGMLATFQSFNEAYDAARGAFPPRPMGSLAGFLSNPARPVRS